MPTLNENLAAGIAALSQAQQIFVAEKQNIDLKKTELTNAVNLKKAELTDTVNTAVAGMAGNVSPFGDLRCFTTAGGQPTWFFGIPQMTWGQLRLDGELGTGICEAFIEAGVAKSTLWIAAYPASMTDGEIVSQPGVMPRTGRTYDEGLAECAATNIVGFEGRQRLMSVWDWALLMHLAIVSGHQPLGNTNYGKSHVNPWLAGRGTAAIATGSMGKASAHNNSNAGIFDLVGNVWEQMQGMYLQDGQIYLAADNGSAPVATGYYFSSSSATASGTPSLVSSAASVTRNGAVGDNSHNLDDVIGGAAGFASLAGAGTVALKRAGIIPVTSATAPAGAIWTRSYGRCAPLRGGCWFCGANSGLGALYLRDAPSLRYSNVGFRPAFVA